MAINLRGDARSDFANLTSHVESGGNDNARNSSSTASGRYQFTDPTFQGYYKQVYGKDIAGAQLAAVKNDPTVQDRLMQAAEQDYTTRLTAAGLPVDSGSKRMLHFFGPTGIKVLQADPGAPIASIVGGAAMAANPSLAGKTVGQVIGQAHAAMRAPGKYNNGEPLPAANPFSSYDPSTYYQQGLGLGPLDARKPVEHKPKDLSTSPQAIRQQIIDSTGGVPSQSADNTPTGTSQVQAIEGQADAVQAQKDGYGAWDRFKAGFQNNSLAAAAYRAIDREHPEASPEWAKHYGANREAIEREAGSQEELDALRESTSQADLDRIKADTAAQKQRQFIQMSGGSTSGLFYGLAGGIADPAGWVAGLGVGKAFQMAGVGARSLYLSGRMGAAAASLATEGALGNVAVTAGLDLAGEHMTPTDYASAAAFGMGIGGLMAPLHLRGIKNAEVEQTARALSEQAAVNTQALHDRAAANVGAGDPNAINLEMRRLDAEARTDYVRNALAPIPEQHRLFPNGEAEADGPAFLTGYDVTPATKKVGDVAGTPEVRAPNAFTQDIITRHGLDAIPDDATRAVAAEHMARAEAILVANPVNKDALKTILKLGNLESTSNTLLSSENPMARAFALMTLENGQGAGGRRSTAAISMTTREKVYLRQIAEYDNAYHGFRKEQGVGLMQEAWEGSARKQFNDRVFAENERRANGLQSHEESGHVLHAADMLGKGYDLMRREQQHVGTVGAARLGEHSLGYQPHRISAGAVARMMENKEQRRAVAQIISEQLQSEDNAFDVHDAATGATTKQRWDKPFADQFANKYLDDAARRAQGGWDIPVNLHDPAAADVVFDTAQALGLPPEKADQLLGKFSRGGAAHTKGRLNLDLSAPIPDGKGGTMPLSKLYNTDGLGLYRAYARRVSGEVSLAQYGIMGKKGLATYRDGMRASGASVEALRAFDQVSAEFLNTPFGEANHSFLDNARIATSLSRLGGMGFTQFGEYGNALPVLGVANTLKAIGSFKRLANEVGQLGKGMDSTNAILKDVDNWAGGVGVSEYHFTRMFDVPDNDIQLYNGETIGIGTRLLRAGGNMQAGLSGHRMILGAQVRGMAEGIVRKAVEFAKSGKEDKALDDIGIGPVLRSRIQANMDKVATFDAKGKLESLDMHAGDLTPVEISDLRQAILRGSSQIIQHTYTGETGKWAHNGMLKLLTQFRTFGIISIEKQWGRNRANYGAMKSFAYLMGAMSFAAPIHLARLQLKTAGMSRTDRESYLKKNLSVVGMARATANYASASGLAGDLYDVGAGVAGGWVGPDFGETIGARGQGQGSLTGLIPALGAVDDAWKAANGNPHKLNSLLPFSNLPFVQPAISAIAPKP